MSPNNEYHVHISAGRGPADLNLREVWEYRDLIWLFTKRTFKVLYKQTVLGPLWLVMSPLFTSVVYTVVFGGIAGLSTEGVPKLLFYLTSHALWSFFADCLNKNSATFIDNARIFGKVYFPRLAIPVSTMISSFIRFLIQMFMVCVITLWYVLRGEVRPMWILLPAAAVMILLVGLMGLGLGVLVSGVTTKYRDLTFLVGFGLTLWMYATPVIYPISQVPGGILRKLILLNPMTAPMELFRMAMLGAGEVKIISCLATIIFTFISCMCGILIFNRVEKTFIDTV